MERVLRTCMLWGGLLLGLALMSRYTGQQNSGQPIPEWQRKGRQWLAGELLQWSRRMIDGTYGAEERQGTKTEETADMDPAYKRFLKEQELRKESAYLLLFGDENSNWTGEEEQKEQETEGGILQKEPPDGAGQSALAMMPAEITGTYHRYSLPLTGTTYRLEQLADYDFLMKYFYNVHSSTTAAREEMNAGELLAVNLALPTEAASRQGQEMPQILIYHTHSQESYADYSEKNPEATVVGVGNYLTQLLEEKGYRVIHDTSVYDLIGGQLDRNHAYNYALDGITGILQKYPSIQVILDLHRDGVDESLHMVSEINGKQTAPIMFFNGMSQTPDGPIEYLHNPYKKENLAFSLQLQLDAAAYYPGLTRKIYLKGLRYNMHLRPRSALIEVGAQTNTYQEALNAMEPLAELLHMVLSGG